MEEFSETVEPKKEKNQSKRKKLSLKITAVMLAACVLTAAAIVPAFFGAYDNVFAALRGEPEKYPYVLVHGLGGWGGEEGINDVAPYWGATTGSLAQYLNSLEEDGDRVFEATVGPVSSSWDRACELYAQLVGGTVDYGAAHSAKCGHKRYGQTYTSALIPSWGGETAKINLVGHSFGGNTVRLLAHLLANGDAAERASGGAVSPLFEGGHGEMIHSVTTLCSPLNGSTLYCVLDDLDLVSLTVKLCFAVAGVSDRVGAEGFFDFRLDQFGITNSDFESGDELMEAVAAALENSTDNAAYDLSPDGAAKLNETIEAVEGVYYFSYSYCTTEKSPLSDNQVPKGSTFELLLPTALLMGRYTREGTESAVAIDKTWLANDGLVNVVSAKYPFDERMTEFNAEAIESGVWNVMPVRQGHHGTVIGLGAQAEETHAFYTQLMEMVDKLA